MATHFIYRPLALGAIVGTAKRKMHTKNTHIIRTRKVSRELLHPWSPHLPKVRPLTEAPLTRKAAPWRNGSLTKYLQTVEAR